MKLKINKKPVIGILANILVRNEGVFAGQKRVYLNHDYVTSIIQAGGVPLLLPLIQDEEIIKQQLENINGLLLSGGYDVHPLAYGEEPSVLLESVYPERDTYELTALRVAYDRKLPIFGVCRGLQLINVALGGTLYQDLSLYEPKSDIQHIQKAERHVATHTVNIVPETRLHSIFERQQILTNSFHHQAIKKLASGLKVNAWAKDGLIEGIEGETSSFVLGVQWHPEMMTEKDPLMLKLFRAFVNEAQKFGENSHDD